jgi:phosphomannomutase
MLSVSGCRGIVGASLTPEVAARFAGAFAGFVREHSSPRALGNPATRPAIVVGRDGRRGCEMVHHAAIAGIIGAGCDAIDLGVAMTPTVAVATDHHAKSRGTPVAGMVLTASHNPQIWNGLKCLLPEGSLHGSSAAAPRADLAAQVIARFTSNAPGLVGWESIGVVERDDAADQRHVDHVLDALAVAGLCDDPAALGAGLGVAVDSVNASGSQGARLLLEALGVEELLHIGHEPTGLFPHPPEPTAENLSLPGGLCDAVREGEAAVGFAQDPDADRLAVIDEKGRYIGEEYTLALSVMAILEAHATSGQPRPALVTNLSTSRMLDDVAARFGARVIRTPVGEANVVEAMKRVGALVGGEGNGGLIWPAVTCVRDSLASMALFLWLLSPAGGGKGRVRTVSELVASIPAYAIRKRKIDLVRKDDAAPALDKVARAFSTHTVDRSDGVWVDLVERRAWLHVRASNTEPIMRLIAEAPTADQADAILDAAQAAMA